MLSAALGVVAFLLLSGLLNHYPHDDETLCRRQGIRALAGDGQSVLRRPVPIVPLHTKPGEALQLLNLLSGMVLLAPAVWARMLSDDLRRKSVEAFGNAARAPEGEPIRLGRLFGPLPERAQSMKKIPWSTANRRDASSNSTSTPTNVTSLRHRASW